MQSWLHEVLACCLPTHVLTSIWVHLHLQEEWISNDRRNYFALLIVTIRLLLDFLYWGKVIIVNTVRNIEWATLIDTQVTFNDCFGRIFTGALHQARFVSKGPQNQCFWSTLTFLTATFLFIFIFYHLPSNKSRRIPLLPILGDLPHAILISF